MRDAKAQATAHHVPQDHAGHPRHPRATSGSPETLQVCLRSHELRLGGRRLGLTPKFLDLYAFLALQRLAGNPRFFTAADIRALPSWSQAKPASVGKEIRRHVIQARRRGWHLIESPPGALTQLFRLAVEAEAVAFDVPPGEVRAHLLLEAAEPAGLEDAEARYVTGAALAQAEWALELGRLDEAAAALARAAEGAERQVRDQVQVRVLRARVLEVQGQARSALAEAEEAVRVAEARGADYLTAARAHITHGWLLGVMRQWEAAHAAYVRARQRLQGTRHYRELGAIFRGLGHLARARGEWDAAAAHFLCAFEYAAADGRPWDARAALYHLGLVETERADWTVEPEGREDGYRRARRWVERCLDVVRQTGCGADAGEAEALLSHIALALRQPAEAARWAREALHAANRAGNPHSQAAALASLGQTLLAVGSAEEAVAPLREAADLYEALGLSHEADRLRHIVRTAAENGRLVRVDGRGFPPGARPVYRRSNGTTQTSPV